MVGNTEWSAILLSTFYSIFSFTPLKAIWLAYVGIKRTQLINYANKLPSLRAFLFCQITAISSLVQRP